MPIYEYYCTECSHSLTKLQKVNNKPLKICPECNKKTLTKKISGAGFILKGTGWYATDFKSKPVTKSTKGSETSKESSASKPVSTAKESSNGSQSENQSQNSSS